MKIESVEVQNFRGLVGPIRVDFSAGLNVVHGPNEIGKTTLGEAIWAGLAQPAKGDTQHHKSLRARESADPPRVAVCFTLGDKRFEVRKTFSGSSGTIYLTVSSPDEPTRELEGKEADDRLRQELGIGAASRGQLAAEGQGAFLLTWVAQGASGVQPGDRLNESTRTSLREHLAERAGEVLVGEEGARVLAAAAREFGRYYTETGAERSGADAPLLAAQRARDAAQAALEGLTARDEGHGELILQRQSLRERIDAAEQQRPQLEKNLADFGQRHRNLERMSNERADRERMRAAEATRHEELRSAREQRAHLRSSRDAQSRRSKDQTLRLQALKTRLGPLEREVEGRRQTAEELRERTRELRRRRDACATQLELADGLGKLTELAGRLARAEEAQRAATLARAEFDALTVTPEKLAEIENLERAARESRIKLESASASIELVRHGEVEIRVDEAPIDTRIGETHKRTVTGTTTLRFGDLATLTVRPGSSDLRRLAADLRSADEALEEALRGLGLESVLEAKKVGRERELAEQRVAHQEQAVGLHAPESLVVLTEAVATLRVASERARARCVEAGVEVQQAIDADDAGRAAIRAAELAADGDERRVRESLESLDHAILEGQQEVHQIRVELAERREVQRAAAAAIVELDTRLAMDSETHGDDDSLEQAIASAAVRADAATNRVAEIEHGLADGALEGARVDLESAQRVVSTHKAEIEQLRVRASVIDGQLLAADMVGIHEKIAHATATLQEAERTLARTTADARAAKLLYTSLRGFKDAAERHLRAPLERGIQELLRLLWPDVTITLDEEFRISAVQRPRHRGSDPFDVLSAGASEQVGLVARLAMARLLATQRPTLLVLDDSLVVTDDERFREMARVIGRVAEEVQILFLTCHWARQRGLGLSPHKVIDMQELLARHADPQT